MKTYIFATDFSQNALHALRFAVPVIQKLKGSILLFHAYEYADPLIGVPISVIEELNREKEKSIKDELLRWKEIVRQIAPALPCRFIARRLPFEQNLFSLVEETEAEGIFMGTQGASGIQQVIMGSNTASVIGKATCPVYAIPEGSNFKGIHSILYATDYQEENGYILDQIGEIATIFGANIEILYVVVENSKLDMEVYEWYQEAVKEKFSKLEVSFKTVSQKNVQTGIGEYVKKNQPDLVVMAMHRKNWITRLLKGSYTRKQVFHTQKPLLILQSESKKKAIASLFQDKFQD